MDKRILGEGRKINRGSRQLKHKDSLSARFSSIHSLADIADLQALLSPEFISDTATQRFQQEFDSGSISNFDRMIRSDLSSYLPGDLLIKADIASMANSLELRSPMLDMSVVEWGIALPRKYKIKGLEGKHILKDVARSLVPKELIDRPKMGFAIPRAEWLRTGMHDLVHDLLTDSKAKQRGWFNPEEVSRTIESHMSGEDLDNLIWPMLMLELWARAWLD
jgi:asparagine synthase (glutamine-hydrolysing)